MAEWTNRDDRQAAARAEYERIMTSQSPDPTGAYIDTGVIGFVFGEMWRRGVLTARDRRFITLSCVGAACDVLGICVVDDAGVDDVLRGLHGALAAMPTAPSSSFTARCTRQRASGCRRTFPTSTSSMPRSAGAATRLPPPSCS